jgi:hypothetical protein
MPHAVKLDTAHASCLDDSVKLSFADVVDLERSTQRAGPAATVSATSRRLRKLLVKRNDAVEFDQQLLPSMF